MPTLHWIGKDKVVNHHTEVPFRVLEHKYGYRGENPADTSETHSGNKIIHGDNLEALKALLPEYEGKIDCVYIDPPYNTGNEGWVYNDNVNDPHIRKWLGEVVGAEGEDLCRHDKWLCMMYPRLRLLHQLLSTKGVIFISIDDNELFNLKHICDEIFGSNCFVSNISWQNNYSLRNDAQGIPYDTDNILVYGRYPNWSPNLLPRTKEMDARYVNYDQDSRPYKVTPIHAPGANTHKSMVYAVQHPFTGELMYPPKGRHWKDGQDNLLIELSKWVPYEKRIIDDKKTREEICGGDVDLDICALMVKEPIELSKKMFMERYDKLPWPKYFFLSKGKGSLQAKTYLDTRKGKVVSTLWKYEDVGTNVEATNELKDLYNNARIFDTPKPTRLLERILTIATQKDSIILDSFAGSGTTAHAVMKKNKEDGGNRKFVLVELMDYAETITAERVRKVITGYGDGKKTKDGLGGAFDYYELGEPLFLTDGKLNESIGVEKIREYIYYTETHEHLSRNQEAEHPYLLDYLDGTGYFFYYKPNEITTLSHDTLNIVPQKAEHYVIYADVCTISKEQLAQMNITFKKIPRDINRF